MDWKVSKDHFQIVLMLHLSLVLLVISIASALPNSCDSTEGSFNLFFFSFSDILLLTCHFLLYSLSFISATGSSHWCLFDDWFIYFPQHSLILLYSQDYTRRLVLLIYYFLAVIISGNILSFTAWVLYNIENVLLLFRLA